jgi:hypothetical protein
MNWKKFITISCSFVTLIISATVAGIVGDAARKGGREEGYGLYYLTCVGIVAAEIIAAVCCVVTIITPCIKDCRTTVNYF